jgi:ATP-binding cassette subfamily F protein uup
LLITHDRHLMERVTDDQFAVVDGKVRHVPGGVDEYLRLLDARKGARSTTKTQKLEPKTRANASPAAGKPDVQAESVLSRAEEYGLKKELASTERKLETLCGKADALRAEAAGTDPSDYVALLDVQERVRDIERQVEDLEDRWVELSEKLS